MELRSENVMVISDLHYPYCDVDEVRRAIKEESPEMVILLGDAVEDVKGFHDFKSSLGNVVHVNGDEDVIKGDDDVVTLFNGGKKFTMLHGHQLMNEEGEKWLAKILMKVNREIPPFLFCLGFRVRISGFLVLGHSHSMSYFPSLQCVNAGTMSLKKNLYNDRGYLLIREGKVNMKRI